MNCSNYHAPIQHEEFHCPLCAALEDFSGSEDALSEANATVDTLQTHIDTSDIADLLQTRIALSAAQTELHALNSWLGRLDAAILGYAPKGLGKRISRITDAAERIRNERNSRS